jgi:hypothetical protein
MAGRISVSQSNITRKYNIMQSLEFFIISNDASKEYTTTDLKNESMLHEARNLENKGLMDCRIEYRKVEQPYPWEQSYPWLSQDGDKDLKTQERVLIYSISDSGLKYFNENKKK